MNSRYADACQICPAEYKSAIMYMSQMALMQQELLRSQEAPCHTMLAGSIEEQRGVTI